MRRISTRQLWILTLVLLLIAASRAIRINDFQLDNDEIWSIWQTMGTPQQIIQWTSPTENPLYFLLLGAWKTVAGFDPFILRYLSLLISLPGTVFMYRAIRRIQGHSAGILAALIYSVLGINIFLSLYARSYVIAYTALPASLWLIHRYFDKPRFSRALLLALTFAVLYTATITIVPAFILLGLYTLFVYRRRILLWWLPVMILLLLTLPDILINKLQQVSNHTAAPRLAVLPPLPAAAFDLFGYLTSSPIWFLMLALAIIGLIISWRTPKRNQAQLTTIIFWLAWVIGVPILLYLLEPRLGFYALKRYAWWYVFGIAIFTALGIVRLPQIGRRFTALVFILVAFLPLRLNDFGYIVTPLGENLKWLTQHIEANDALMLDPNISCNFPEEWDYYRQLYFPAGLRYVDQPQDARRLWYVASRDLPSQEVEKSLAKDHLPGRYVGPPGCFFRLYEAPPDAVGVLYPNGMRFHGAEIMDGDKPLNGTPVMREGQIFRVRLWWSVDKQVDLDYSVSLSLSRVVIENQSDSAPQIVYPEDAPNETSRWQTGQIYVEERDLQIPYPYSRGGLALNMALYWFGDNQRLTASGVAADGNRFLKRIEVVAW